MAQRKKRYSSRLVRKESQRMMRQGILFLVLTVGLVVVLVVWGVPAMVKLAGFLGEIRSSSQPIDTGDKIAPFAPQLSIGYEATASARIDVSGFAEAEATVVLFNSGNKISEVIVDEDGSFVFSDIRLDEGVNEFEAQAMDSTGNESPMSKSRRVVFDNTNPTLGIDSVDINGDNLRSEEKLYEVRGSTDPGAKVYVNDRFARVDDEGYFSVRVPLNEGENTIRVRAIDLAENESVLEFGVSYYE